MEKKQTEKSPIIRSKVSCVGLAARRVKYNTIPEVLLKRLSKLFPEGPKVALIIQDHYLDLRIVERSMNSDTFITWIVDNGIITWDGQGCTFRIVAPARNLDKPNILTPFLIDVNENMIRIVNDCDDVILCEEISEVIQLEAFKISVNPADVITKLYDEILDEDHKRDSAILFPQFEHQCSSQINDNNSEVDLTLLCYDGIPVQLTGRSPIDNGPKTNKE